MGGAVGASGASPCRGEICAGRLTQAKGEKAKAKGKSLGDQAPPQKAEGG